MPTFYVLNETGTKAIDQKIQELVDLETRAWDTKDVDTLLSLFHPDMVWAWPPTPEMHDPVDWVFVMGRFDEARWKAIWARLFRENYLVHNKRNTRKIIS